MSRFSVLFLMVLGLVTVSYSEDQQIDECQPGSLMYAGEGKFRNCYDIHRRYPTAASGIYTIYPYDCCRDHPVTVYCDMKTDGGGWTVIQRRDVIEPRETFNRTWMEYALGFGKLNGEFWLGLDHIHTLTEQSLNEIRFDLIDIYTESRFAHYNFFYIHNRENNYKLEVNGYSGTAGDSFSIHNQHDFSTYDKDLDTSDENCAVRSKGAWWYADCHESNLNGYPYPGKHTKRGDGINWKAFRGYGNSLRTTHMKIRPAY